MKVTRQSKILELINSKNIETQEELAEELERSGMKITQATISRDIKELKLIKVLSQDGKYKYASIEHEENVISKKLVLIFKQTVINVENVGNMIIIKTVSGSAMAAAEAMDSLKLEGIAGSIAGDNTIFVLVRSNDKANELVQKIKNILKD